MKSLVVFYSRDGAMRKTSEALFDLLNCDVEEIIDTKNRQGFWGYLSSGLEVSMKIASKIAEPKKDTAAYDVVLVGTPIWAGAMAPAVRAYIGQNKAKFKEVAFFCTTGGTGGMPAFREMEAICGKKPLAVLELGTEHVVNSDMPNFVAKVKQFAEKFRK